jgi:hypothetical protein
MAKHARDSGPATEVNGPTPVHDRPPGPAATGPRHAASTRTGMRRLVGIAVCLVLAGAAVGYVVVNGNPSRATIDGAGAPASATAIDHGQSRAPTSTPSTVSTAQTAPETADGSVTATGAGGPPTPVPSTGAGVTGPGILLIATPASDGSFDVDERVWLGQSVNALTLRPAQVDRAGREFASASGTATQVRLSAGDRTVTVPDEHVDRASTVPVTEGDHFELRYRLTDVTVISTPSTAGRALAAIGPLTGNVGEDLPVHFIVTGPSVLGLNCPLLPFAEQSCGSRTPTGPGFEHELPARLALATVQFDLPPA